MTQAVGVSHFLAEHLGPVAASGSAIALCVDTTAVRSDARHRYTAREAPALGPPRGNVHDENSGKEVVQVNACVSRRLLGERHHVALALLCRPSWRGWITRRDHVIDLHVQHVPPED